jgi:DNA primase
VQEPLLASDIHETVPALDMPGAALFKEVVENIRQYSLHTTGALLEHWRDRKERKLLEKLAWLEHAIPTAGIKQEFLGAIEKLRKLSYNQQIKQLLEKAGQNSLSSEEKQLLHELILHNKEKP